MKINQFLTGNDRNFLKALFKKRKIDLSLLIWAYIELLKALETFKANLLSSASRAALEAISQATMIQSSYNKDLTRILLSSIPMACVGTQFENSSIERKIWAVAGELARIISKCSNSGTSAFSNLTQSHDNLVKARFSSSNSSLLIEHRVKGHPLLQSISEKRFDKALAASIIAIIGIAILSVFFIAPLFPIGTAVILASLMSIAAVIGSVTFFDSPFQKVISKEQDQLRKVADKISNQTSSPALIADSLKGNTAVGIETNTGKVKHRRDSQAFASESSLSIFSTKDKPEQAESPSLSPQAT